MRKARRRKTIWKYLEMGKLNLRDGDLVCVRLPNGKSMEELDAIAKAFEKMNCRVPVMFISGDIRISVVRSAN